MRSFLWDVGEALLESLDSTDVDLPPWQRQHLAICGAVRAWYLGVQDAQAMQRRLARPFSVTVEPTRQDKTVVIPR